VQIPYVAEQGIKSAHQRAEIADQGIKSPEQATGDRGDIAAWVPQQP
jgi:hypothetical protein